ncbi:MAG: fibronectin type III domain-containing protein [bacterium]
MLLKIYKLLQAWLAQNELKLATKLDKRDCDLSFFSLFNFQVIFLNQLVVLQAIFADIIKYLIVLFYPHSDSFIVLFKQKEQKSCNFSYFHYKTIQKQVRVFSVAGIITLVVSTVVVSLITNLMFGGKQPSWAATYGWNQAGFSGGATTTIASHPGNQSLWNYFFSKDPGISIAASGTLALQTVNSSIIQTTDTEFNAGTMASTSVLGANSAANLQLNQDYHINEYTVGHLANVSVTVTAVNQGGPWLLVLSGTPNLGRIFKNDKFVDSTGKPWKVLSLNPSTTTPRLLVIDSEGNGTAPAAGVGSVGRWYSDLAAWETGRQGDLVARNAIERALPYYDVGPDTTPLAISGWTTDATHYVEINVPLGERHRGKWDDGKYRLETAVGMLNSIDIVTSFVRIIGMQIRPSGNNSDYVNGITTANITGASGSIVIDSNLFKGNISGGSQYAAGVFANAPVGNIVKISNNIIYDFKGATTADYGLRLSNNVFAYNNTIYNCGAGFFSGNNLVTIKNNIVQLTTYVGNAYMGNYAAGSTNNISDEANAPGTNPQNLKTVSFVDAANKDFHLEFNDAAAKNTGADLSADANLPIVTDIDGDTRTGTWDIGADDVGTVYLHTSSIGTNARDFATLQAWEDNRGGVLTNRFVFKLSSQTGAFINGESVTGQTSGNGGSYIRERATPSANEKYMTLMPYGGAFQVGETIIGATSGSTAIISSIVATSTIEKGEVYNDSVFTAGVNIAGSTVDASHYLWLTAEPRSRHWGVAGTGARINNVSGTVIDINNFYTKVSFLEVSNRFNASNYGIMATYLMADNAEISNNLVYYVNKPGGNMGGAIWIEATGKAFNNIVYNDGGNGVAVQIGSIYNNTIYNTAQKGILYGNTMTTLVASNNISMLNTNGDYGVAANGYDSPSGYNFSSDGTATGAAFQSNINNKINIVLADIKFVSTDPSLIDLHLMPGSVAKNAGADLSATFKTDIDGNARPTGINTWDIGADEWQASSPIFKTSGTFVSSVIDLGVKADISSITLNANTTAGTNIKTQIAVNNDNATWNFVDVGQAQSGIPIYYSVGQNTLDHKTGLPSISITSGVATFSVAQTATNMGVGDKITYNGATVAYIAGKISTTQWNVVTKLGAVPADVTNQAVNSIAHAFSSLNAATTGASGVNFLNTADLVSNNYQLNFPCYYDTGADTAAVAVSGYTTGVNNFIKIYTPNNILSEVNQSQKHAGKWDNAKYRLDVTTDAASALNSSIAFLKIAGLQIKLTKTNYTYAVIRLGTSGNGGDEIEFSNNIVTGSFSGAGTAQGVEAYNEYANKILIYNNIVYGIKNGVSPMNAIINNYVRNNKVFIYNNTVYDSYVGIATNYFPATVKNNIVQSTIASNYAATGGGSFFASSTNNLASDATAPGTNPQNSKTVSFLNLGALDFHLSSSDATAKNAGINLSADANLPFSTDIDGQYRTGMWDIGADEEGASSSLGVNRYIKYKTFFTSDSVNTPSLNDVTLTYSSLPASASLISSPYNTMDATNLLAKLQWGENLLANTDVTFQVRTSPDNALWSSWQGPDGTSGTSFTDPTGGELMPNTVRDGSGDQYIQYKATLLSDGVSTPEVSFVNTTYVVNAPPIIMISTTTPISQAASGTVTINYTVRDADTTSGSAANQGKATIGLEYCTANCTTPGGETWVAASDASLSGQFGTTTVEEVNMLPYSLIWKPSIDYANHYFADGTFKIRLTANDNEAANNIGRDSSNLFLLDTKKPNITSFIVNGAASTNNISIIATDDSSYNMELSPNADFAGATSSPFSANSIFDLSAKPSIVYLRLTDSYNNISSTSVAIPETPQAMMIQDNSNMFADPHEYRLFLAWKVPANPVAGFDHYAIERSTDNVTFTNLTNTTDRLINYFGDSSTVMDQNYYYRISVVDTLGNVSYLSAIMNGKANGTQDAGEGGGGVGTLGVAPIIASVATTSVFTTQATISWNTNELADSVVYYQTATGSDFSTALNSGVATLRQDGTSLYGAHSVNITNLEPSTTYYFYVESTNAKSVTASSTSLPDGYSFTTAAGPKISGVSATNVANTGATIEWNTDQVASTYVVYSTSSDMTNATEIGTADAVSRHGYNLTGLTPGTRYYFYVKSGSFARGYRTNGNPFELVTTSDVTPPLFLTITHTAVGESTAMIIWQTDELADSRLEYWSASSTGTILSLPANPTFTIDHVYSLINLATTTKYYYRISSSDQSGNAATSTADETTSFTTSEKQYGETDYLDKINQLKTLQDLYNNASSTNQTTIALLQAQIEQLTTLVNSLTSTASSSGSSSQVQIDQLNAEIKALRAELTQAKSRSGGGTLIIDKTDKISPTLSNIQVNDLTATSAVVSWITNEKADSFVSFVSDQAPGYYGSWIMKDNHLAELNNLMPGSKYKYKVASRDESGNLAISGDYDFNTKKLPPEVAILATVTPVVAAEVTPALVEAAAKNMMELMNNLSKVVSISSFESTVLSQFNSLQKLAGIIPGPVLSGEPLVTLTPTTVTINWHTDKAANSMIAYAPEILYSKNKGSRGYLQLVGEPDLAVTEHLVKIVGLKPDTTYHYQLRSKAVVGAEAQSRDFTFKTRPEALEIISSSNEVLSPQSVNFRWLTSEQTNTQISIIPYRNNQLSVDEARSIMDKTYTTNHEMVINDLNGGEIYQIEISGVDLKGKKITKNIPYFSTTKDDLPPEIEQIKTESALSQGRTLKVQTVISWQTNEPAISQVLYGKGVIFGENDLPDKLPLETAYSRKHTAIITNFDPGSVYSFRIKALDSGGNETLSNTHTILTPQQRASVFDLIIKNFESTFGWLGSVGK